MENLLSVFDNKTILITGGTGSLGQSLTKRLLKFNVKSIRIFSRNESKQIEMETKFHDDRLRFFVGDIRDLNRLIKATEDADIVFHTAALKHVPKIEYNPFEAIKTNVIGSQNVIDACLHENVEKSICVGTDKAVSPLNTYGATKLLMEKLFVSANNSINKEKYKTKFIALRYGNVLGSSGSVIPKFIQQIKSKNKLTITEPKMTRFSITMDEAINFILNASNLGQGSEIFIPKLKAYSIKKIKDSLFELLGNTGDEIIGLRPGEKLQETLINSDELRYTWEINNMYVIINPFYSLFNGKIVNDVYDGIQKVDLTKQYSSDNVEQLTVDELKSLIKNSGLL